jgi:hypothetical protein
VNVGLVHVILFACTGRVLPPNSVLPRFISRPKILLSSTAVASSDFIDHYGAAETKSSESTDAEKRNEAILSSITEAADPRNPFADPVLPPIDESIIRRMHSPDSDYNSSDQSPHRIPRALSPIPADYVDRSFLPDPPSPVDPVRARGEARLGHGLAV